MSRLRMVLGVLALVLVSVAGSTVPVSDACAQATCRNKCNDEEQDCLKRTNNKGQCGNKAKDCLGKCK
jgi:hypothetical protein